MLFTMELGVHYQKLASSTFPSVTQSDTGVKATALALPWGVRDDASTLHLTPKKRAYLSLWIFHFRVSRAKLGGGGESLSNLSGPQAFPFPDSEAVVAATSSPQPLALSTGVRGKEKTTPINDRDPEPSLHGASPHSETESQSRPVASPACSRPSAGPGAGPGARGAGRGGQGRGRSAGAAGRGRRGGVSRAERPEEDADSEPRSRGPAGVPRPGSFAQGRRGRGGGRGGEGGVGWRFRAAALFSRIPETRG